MGTEIERKFLLRSDRWKGDAHKATQLRQGYLAAGPGRSVRIRIAGTSATLTIKGPSEGRVRAEYEYAVPLEDAEEMLDTLALKPLIEKTRYLVDFAGKRFEIDIFEGANAGLEVAEIELETAGEHFERPPWLGREVTDDTRYLNASLAREPFSDW